MATHPLLEPMDTQRQKTLATFDTLTDADLAAVHRETGWSVRQLLAHIAASELGSAFFVRRANDGDIIEMDLEARDQFNDLETEKAESFDLKQLRVELTDSSEALREVFAELTDEDLGKAILWPAWPAKTIGESVPYMAEHEAEHLAQIEEALRSE